MPFCKAMLTFFHNSKTNQDINKTLFKHVTHGLHSPYFLFELSSCQTCTFQFVVHSSPLRLQAFCSEITNEQTNEQIYLIVWPYGVLCLLCLYIPPGRGGLTHKKNRRVCRTLQDLKKVVLVSLRMVSLKMSTAGAFVVPFRILSRKTQDGKELVRLMGGNNFKSLPQNGILVALLFNILDAMLSSAGQ